MFFSLSRRKIVILLVIFGLVLAGATIALYVENKWNVRQAISLKMRSAGEDISYWWSYKAFNRLAAGGIYPSGQTATSVPILVYHGIPDEGAGDNPFDSAHFAEQMAVLKAAGWHTITLDQFIAFMNGDLALPDKSFLLTFDDGRKDTFYPADPVLKDTGFHAVMFAITKRSLSPDSKHSSYYMSEYELKEMEKSGRWEVESHGRDSHDWYYVDSSGNIGHFFSNLLWVESENRTETPAEFTDRVVYDLATSKSDLERVLGKKIRTFAFPFSDFGQDSVNFSGSKKILAAEIPKIYDMAFYQVWNGTGETFNYPGIGSFMMKRIEPPADWEGSRLLEELESGMAKTLPYQPSSYGLEWVVSWGEISRGNTLALAATPDTSGATSMLNGSRLWKDYVFSADVDWKAGSNIVLIALRQDDDNYYGCNFDPSRVYIKKVSNGKSSNLVSQDYQVKSSNPLTLGISVSGSRISCLVNGNVVLSSASVSSGDSSGGIGLEIWDKLYGRARANFSNLTVVER